MTTRAAYIGPTILLTLIQTTISWAVFAPPVLAKQALGGMGIDPTWIGVQPTILFAAAMFSSILGPPLVLRFNPMRASQALALLAGSGAALIGTGSLVLGGVGSVLIGLALGPATPASSHILFKVTPPRLQPATFSIKQTGVPIGGALAGLVGPPVMLWWDWHAAMFVITGACVLAAIAVQPWVRHYDEHATGQRAGPVRILGSMRTLLTVPSLRWLTVGVAPMLFAQYALITFLVLYLQQDIGLSVVAAGSVFAAAQIAGGAGRVIFGLVSGRWLRPLTMLVTLSAVATISTGVTALFAPDWPLAAIYAASIVYGAVAIGWNGIYLAETARLSPPGQVGQTTGTIGFLVFASVVVGPVAFAGFAAITGFATAYLIIAGTVTASTLAFSKTRRLAG